MDDHKIIIRRVVRDEKTGSPEDTVHVFHSSPASRWLLYLLLVPAFIVMAILGIFFFTAFLALFAVVATGLALRLWWLRRELRKPAAGPDHREGEYQVIEDAEIVEEKSTRKNDERQRGEQHKDHP
ncbi:MAG TPA: hypothetical protein VFI43_08360 [Nitrosospira sp.]|nr:hypothetical protein [Nitrosospira sp.]